MPRRAEHEKEAMATFGKPYTEVHKWLDEFHDVPGYGGVAHRKKRHHLAGVEYVRKWLGEEAAHAAYQHIVADLIQVGWTGPLPENEADCERLGIWVTK